MYTFWLNEVHWTGECFVRLEHPRITVTHNGRPVPLKDVPSHALADVLNNLHGLLNNGRWSASL
jgi:hypothetical protein